MKDNDQCPIENAQEGQQGLSIIIMSVSEFEHIQFVRWFGFRALLFFLKKLFISNQVKNCPICKRNNTRDDFDFPETMNCCDDCGADFLNDGEVILHPKEI